MAKCKYFKPSRARAPFLQLSAAHRPRRRPRRSLGGEAAVGLVDRRQSLESLVQTEYQETSHIDASFIFFLFIFSQCHSILGGTVGFDHAQIRSSCRSEAPLTLQHQDSESNGGHMQRPSKDCSSWSNQRADCLAGMEKNTLPPKLKEVAVNVHHDC